MDKNLIEKYKNEFKSRYSANKKAVPAAVVNPVPEAPQQGFYIDGEPITPDINTENGRLIFSVTSIGGLYPVINAKVTVFKGEYDTPEVIATVYTNRNGKTEAVSLPAPPQSLSMQADSPLPPYELYSTLVEADGYTANLHLNIPIFRGITSLQGSNLIPLSSAGDRGPIVFNELSQYNL